MPNINFCAQTTRGVFVPLDSTRRLFYAASTVFSETLPLNTYNGGTHLALTTDSTEDPSCKPSGHINNTKYLADSGSASVSVNGAAAINVTALTSVQVPLRITYTDSTAQRIKLAKFWVYDGKGGDAVPVSGATFKGYEVGNGTSWSNINGSGVNALTLADQSSAATTHNWYIALSMQSTTTGSKLCKFKVVLTAY